MKYIIKTLDGIEEAVMIEVKDILGERGKKVLRKRVQFQADSIKKFSKETKISSEIYELIKKFNFSNKKDLIKKIKNIDFDIKKDFVVRCSRSGSQNFNSQEIEKLVGGIIYEKGNKVNLKSKEIIYLDIEDKICFLGKLVSKDLCKRKYRLHVHNQSVNACLAAALIKLSKIKKNETLVDPFCKDSVIPIEAYRQGIKKVFAFDSEKNNIRNSRINAKLAKANIKLSSLEIDWLDTRFKKNSVRIVANLPFESKNRPESTIIPVLKEFFHQARYVGKNPLIALTQKPKLAKELAKGEKFSIKEKKVKRGESSFSILILKK